MKMISLGKSLEMSISLHFAYINSYMYTFICSVSISMDISKMNKFIENLAKLFNKATSFLVTKRTMQLSLIILIYRNIFLSSDLEIWRRGVLSVQHEMRTSYKDQKNRGWATKLFPNNGLSIFNHPSWNPDASGQSSGQEQDLEGPSVDPFRVPDLDDL